MKSNAGYNNKQLKQQKSCYAEKHTYG